MRAIALLIVISVMAPSSSFSASINLAEFEEMVTRLSAAVPKIKSLLEDARLAQGASRTEKLEAATSELMRLQPLFNEAKRASAPVEHAWEMEQWRKRTDAVSDLLDGYSKVKQLDSLIAQNKCLVRNLCPRDDLYQWNGQKREKNDCVPRDIHQFLQCP